MSPEARTRILNAVDLNPARSRVTIRRDDARDILAENDTIRVLVTEAQAKLCELREEREDLRDALTVTTDSLNEATDLARLRSAADRAKPTWLELVVGVIFAFAAGWLVPATHLLTVHHG